MTHSAFSNGYYYYHFHPTTPPLTHPLKNAAARKKNWFHILNIFPVVLVSIFIQICHHHRFHQKQHWSGRKRFSVYCIFPHSLLLQLSSKDITTTDFIKIKSSGVKKNYCRVLSLIPVLLVRQKCVYVE